MRYKIITTIYIFSIISVLSIYFTSCNENNMINISDVSGKVFYGEHPAANVKVSIGVEETRTASDGSFQLKNINFPYNITLLDSAGGNVSVFKNLSTGILNLDLINFNTGYNFVSINFTLPNKLLNDDLHGKIIFTDGENVNGYANFNNHSETALYINLPGYIPVTGKIILLTYKINSSGNIVSYENFGVKENYLLNPEKINYFTFTPKEVATNPGEVTVSGSVINPPANDGASAYVLSFSDKSITEISGFNSFGGATGNSFQVTIPTGISEPFNTLIYKQYYTGSFSSELFKVYPDSPNVHYVNVPAVLNTPENQATSVNNATLFSFSEGSGKGINEVIIKQYNTSIVYRILTTSASFTLGDIDQSGFGSIINNGFIWSVRKIGVHDSMNEFVTNRLDNAEWFYTFSSDREFFTHP